MTKPVRLSRPLLPDLHPPAGGWGGIRWQFYVVQLLVALGGCLVTLYKPAPAAESVAGELSAAGGHFGPVTGPQSGRANMDRLP
jgi:hypothetical protein